MSDNQDVSRKAKRPYRTPELVRIELRAEEAVLGNCKKTGGTGPGAGNCHSVGNCHSIGS